MLVRVKVTNTPLSRQTIRLMIKSTVILSLVYVFGLSSLYAVAAYLIISKLTTRRTQVPLTFKKPRTIKSKKLD